MKNNFNWDKYYLKRSNRTTPYDKKIINELTSMIRIKHKNILEVGSGRGGNSLYLAKLGANVVCLDMSSVSLGIIMEKNQNLSCVLGDIRKLPFKKNKFDVIFSQGVLEHFEEPNIILDAHYNLLKKGGIILIDVPQKYNIYTIFKKLLIFLKRWPNEIEYDQITLRNLLIKHKFKIKRIYGRSLLIFWICQRYNIFFLKSILKRFTELLEKTNLAPKICLNLGIIAQKE